jgi:hypothetical protein
MTKVQSVHPEYEMTIDAVIKMFMKKFELTIENRDIQWEKKLINKQFEENFNTNTYDNDLLKAELEK